MLALFYCPKPSLGQSRGEARLHLVEARARLPRSIWEEYKFWI